MMNDIFLYTGSIMIILWGVAHIVPTRSVVNGFGPISKENRRIITMEWIAEGLTLCFIGVLVLFVIIGGGGQNPVSIIVYRLCALMLLLMAGLTSFTGARTSITPMKICPLVKASVAGMFFLGTLL